MAETNVTFATFAATPIPTAWSQSYHAGKLYAAISLSNPDDTREDDFLSLVGKEVLSTLEEEYFTLEDKSFENTKEAIRLAIAKLPAEITSNLVVCSLTNGTANVYVKGKGSATLKRGDEIGALLSDTTEFEGASGQLFNKDKLLLEVGNLRSLVAPEEILKNDGTPTEVIEALSPTLHTGDEADAACILLSFAIENDQATTVIPTLEEDEKTDEVITSYKQEKTIDNLESSEESANVTQARPDSQAEEPQQFVQPKQNRRGMSPVAILTFPLTLAGGLLSFFWRLNHKRKLYLTIGIILLTVLIFSVYTTLQKREEERVRVAFQSVYEPAQKKYDEGQGLLSLNKNLARENFEEAKKIVLEGKGQFKIGSKEEKELATLIVNIDKSVEEALDANLVDPTPVTKTKSGYLELVKKTTDGKVSQDDTTLFVATDTDITAITKSNQKSKVIAKNNKTWESIAGLSPYIANVYLLDKTAKQIYKFTATKTTYAKSNYLTGETTVDLADGVDMAIDGSVYVLLTDGTIAKYTRGKQDTFMVSGLDKPFENPVSLVTSVDMGQLYVLDRGNSRIVILTKAGGYQAQYQSKQMGTATAMEVLEKEKKILFLSGSDIFEIAL